MSLSKPELQKVARQMKIKGRARASKPKLQKLIVDDMNHKLHDALRPFEGDDIFPSIPKDYDFVLIGGPSGSGKTVWASRYIKAGIDEEFAGVV